MMLDALATGMTPILYTPGPGQIENYHRTANTDTRQGGSSLEQAGQTPDAVTMDYAITQNTDWAYCAIEILGIVSSFLNDHKVAVDGADTTADFLDAKIEVLAGTNMVVTKTIQNPGANEKISYLLDASGGGGSGTSLAFNINQTGHGLSVGDVIKSNGVDNEFAQAQADSSVNAEAVGIVTVVTDADNFTYVSSAIQLSSGFVPVGTPGDAVFLDPTVAGGLTITKPTGVGQVIRALGTIIASGSTMYFDIAALGEEITGTGSGGSAALKVGVGSADDIDWFNIQYPFLGPGAGAPTAYGFWNLNNITSSNASWAYREIQSQQYFHENSTDYDELLPDFDDANGQLLFATTKQFIMQIVVQTSATSANKNSGGIGFDTWGGTSARSSQGSTAFRLITFARKDSDGTWYTHCSDGVGMTENLITISDSATHTLRIECDPGNATPQVRFYVDGILVDTITTNLPFDPADFNVIGFTCGNDSAANDSAITFACAPAFAIEV
jgi:hypothetical protein